MNKFGLLTSLLAFILVNCINPRNKQTKEQEDVTHSDQSFIDTPTSEMSLDWIGVYVGTMPCADCEGIETMIELKDGNYYISHYKYLGKSGDANEFTNEGPFNWNDDGNSIFLQAEVEPTQYKVGENYIILLNVNGEVNTGDLADRYMLKKRI